jgi:N-acetylmuramoyl-L-alanine amidase
MLAAALSAFAPESLFARQQPARRTIVVDAGHGGRDQGMHGPIGGGPPIYEKNITLAVAKKLAAELESRGMNVVMTRKTDTLIMLGDQGKIANDAKGDLFISIHVNAANLGWKDPGGARGFETYFLAEAKTEDERRVAKMENASARFDTRTSGDSDNPLSFLLNDMMQNEHLRESSDLAMTIQGELKKVHPGPSRGVKQAGFMVLVTAFMPSVLVEIGFGTNPSEAAWISSSDGQRQLATAIADGAMEYLQHFDRRSSAGGGAGPASPR